MSIVRRFGVPALAGMLVLLSEGAALAQPRPYIGYAYPAGAQRGTTAKVRLGGQQINDVEGVVVSGDGVTARVVEYHRHLNPQEIQLLRGQLTDLGVGLPGAPAKAKGKANAAKQAAKAAKAKVKEAEDPDSESPLSPDARRLIDRIRERLEAHVPQPASNAIANLIEVEVTVAADAPPGAREIRVVTPKGVSNPLVFDIGQVPEVLRKPMNSARLQVLGKEEQSLRSRPAGEAEQRVTLPCTLNGQVASGEVNTYRFAAKKGQRLVFSTAARRLIPFLADAVPGWFQPVLSIRDDRGHEVAYDDDYRFRPDPVILFKVPKDGEYVLAITDALYRGREDFVYRITAGELPFVTSLFPLGARAGRPAKVHMTGWNLDKARPDAPPDDAAPGIIPLAARTAELASNSLPFAIDTLPETVEAEPDGPSPAPADLQKLSLPIIVNGRIGRPGDRDVFRFEGHAGERIVAEVIARRLDSPLDSVLTIADASGKILARNDDREDPTAGTNTHDADSSITLQLPADGTYRIELTDAAKGGGEAFGYRLRVGPPRPDFALRLVPSSLALRAKASAAVTVHADRRDGFEGPIKIRLASPPAGFNAPPVTLAAGQDQARLTIRTTLSATPGPVDLAVEGVAQVAGREVVRRAVPAEDRMQAFLWRHLVPATDFPVLVFDPKAETKPRRPAPAIAPPVASEAKPPTPPANANATTAAKPAPGAAGATVATTTTPAPKFNEKQIAGRLRQLKILYEEDLLTDDFYRKQVAECQVLK